MRIALIILSSAIWWGCGDGVSGRDAHLHNEPAVSELSATACTDSSEVFIKYEPLVANSGSRLTIYVSKQAEYLEPCEGASVTVSLIVDQKGIRNKATAADHPGVYNASLRPSAAGVGRMVLNVQTATWSEQVMFDSIPVFESHGQAVAALRRNHNDEQIHYGKEQAWKAGFASELLVKKDMNDVIRASGQIISPPGDEVTIAAPSAGIVKFASGFGSTGIAIRSGQPLFSIAGGNVAADNNIDASVDDARLELSMAKAEYERLNELIQDKLVTQEEFQQARLRYVSSQKKLARLSSGYGNSGKRLHSPVSGFLKSTLVSEGQYVEAGQPLAVVNRSRRVMLRVDVPLKDIGAIEQVQDANFRLQQNAELFNTGMLNGRLVSVAKATVNNSPLLPVYFEIDASPGLLQGTFAEVYLKSRQLTGVLAVPQSALIEEQGSYYVYVQTGGESFEKREVKTGANDGQQVQLINGVSQGERVVTKGTYKIKLASVSSAMPVHDHAH